MYAETFQTRHTRIRIDGGAHRVHRRAICDDRWKLIRYPIVNKSQFFDLQTDPHEMTNLAGKPEFADKEQ